MTQKTAMQELKDRLVQMRNEAHINCLEEYKNAMNAAIVSVESLLEKEKQQIIDSHVECVKQGTERESETEFTEEDELIVRKDIENYYNQTYGGGQ